MTPSHEIELKERHNIAGENKSDIPTIRDRTYAARLQLRTVKRNRDEISDNHLYDLALRYDINCGWSEATIVQQRWIREASRTIVGHLKSYYNPFGQGSIQTFLPTQGKDTTSN